MLVLVFLFGVVLPTLVTVLCFIGFLVCWYRFRYRRLALIKKCSARSRVHAVVQAPLVFDDIPVRPLIAANETARNSGFIALHPIRISACLDPAVRLTGSRRGSITTTSSLRLLSASDRSSTVSISPADDIEQISASSEATSSFSRRHASAKRNSGAAVRRTTYFRPPTSASTNQAETCGGSGLDDDNGYVLTEFIYTSSSASSDRGDDVVTPTTRTSRLPVGETRSRVSFETDEGAKVSAAHTDCSRKRRTVSIVDQTTSARCVTAIVHNSPGGTSACFTTSTVTVNEQLGGRPSPVLPASDSQETIVDKFGYVDVDLLDKQLKSRGQQSAVSTSTIRSYYPAVSASNRLHRQTAVPKTLADSRTTVNDDIDDAPNYDVNDDVTLASSADKTDVTAPSGCKQPERISRVNGNGRNFSTEIYSTYRTSPS